MGPFTKIELSLKNCFNPSQFCLTISLFGSDVYPLIYIYILTPIFIYSPLSQKVRSENISNCMTKPLLIQTKNGFANKTTLKTF